jgi:hypothetical protein
MGGPTSEGLEICLASSARVPGIDGEEGDQFDRVHLDLAVAQAMATAILHRRQNRRCSGTSGGAGAAKAHGTVLRRNPGHGLRRQLAVASCAMDGRDERAMC